MVAEACLYLYQTNVELKDFIFLITKHKKKKKNRNSITTKVIDYKMNCTYLLFRTYLFNLDKINVQATLIY